MHLIYKKAIELGIPICEINRYNEPHRFYHNMSHIEAIVNSAVNKNILSNELFLAIIFHDIIYNPKANDNEEKSVELYYKYFKNEEIAEAIMETKTHNPKTTLGKQLCELDLEVINSDFETFIDFENKIFKEYQWVDYSVYKEKRIEVLEKLGVKKEWIDYVRFRKPLIGLYAGSFNPFHKGHFNVLQKAEQIFDKVILLRGINPDKKNDFVEMPDVVQFRQTEYHDGLLTDFIENLKYDVTLVRGLRNANDLNYEMNQYRFLQDLKPNIKVISVFCDKEFEHISSSAIRQLKHFNKGNSYLI